MVVELLNGAKGLFYLTGGGVCADEWDEVVFEQRDVCGLEFL